MTFEEGVRDLKDQALSMMIHVDGEIAHSSRERGIKPLYVIFTDGIRFAGGALLIDRVIGLGAARIAAEIGITKVWALVMSEPAKTYLTSVGIEVQHNLLVDHIQNREGTGFCPVETIAVNTRAEESRWFEAMMEEIRQFLTRIGAI
ncbi:MAG: DUF1893 domain-containing protein [Acidaminobacter sp.]|uniref:DUF1893 domain-containing protein n=1 Tax=Acidaminobacter sp. TaxID=1872102 RepID=UPI0013808082|nr:DUF1893 domain-containing protein [Acidaminobacter sp.]MZQ99245.1 DUF1893 domain-containing protein [Acidaminobacter sp.]